MLFGKRLEGKNRVLSVEPTPNAIARLRRNIELNEVCSVVIVYEGAVSDHSGTTGINLVLGKEEYSSLGQMMHLGPAGESCTTASVACTTVDQLTEKHSLDPGFVKIDVEGMEHAVLGGMQNVLKRNRPVILSELSDPLLRSNGSSAAEVIEFISEQGYHVFDPIDASRVPGRGSGNILCLPTDRRVT